CLEFGLPQASTRRANPKPFEEYEANLAHWQREHQADRLQEKLERGIGHYERTFGARPCAFRAPCFGVSPGMYEALYAVGITVSSSRGINPTATAWALGKSEGPKSKEGPNTGSRFAGIRPHDIPPQGRIAADDATIRPLPDLWQPDFPCRPWTEPPGVLEVPCMEDLLIGGVTAEQADERLALIISELEHCLAEAGDDGVLVIGSHYASMARTWEQTRPLLEAMFEWLARQGVTEWMTFAQYVTILSSVI
ncbi:MAG: hypothetical protein KKI08_24720, partial [Armatimonadetes bacterium]|nr:hypothetical protein [Armatimonadota bacterium]